MKNRFFKNGLFVVTSYLFSPFCQTDLSESCLVFWLINKFQVVFETFRSSGKFIKLNANKGVPVMS